MRGKAEEYVQFFREGDVLKNPRKISFGIVILDFL